MQEFAVFLCVKVSQDFWPGLSENPPFNKTLDNIAKLEYVLPILEEITLRHP